MTRLHADEQQKPGIFITQWVCEHRSQCPAFVRGGAEAQTQATVLKFLPFNKNFSIAVSTNDCTRTHKIISERILTCYFMARNKKVNVHWS